MFSHLVKYRKKYLFITPTIVIDNNQTTTFKAEIEIDFKTNKIREINKLK